MYLVDTNVLLRFVDTFNHHHKVARSAILSIQQQQKLCVSSQNCVEFWNVMTRPKQNNGFGFSPTIANQGLEGVQKLNKYCIDIGYTLRFRLIWWYCIGIWIKFVQHSMD